MYVERTIAACLARASEQFRVLMVTGPRQVGKTTCLQHAAGPERAYVTLDIIFDLVDEMLLVDQFIHVDRILVGIKPRDLSTDLLLAFLTTTLPAREQLPHRRALVKNVRQVLRDRDGNECGLLVGLVWENSSAIQVLTTTST